MPNAITHSAPPEAAGKPERPRLAALSDDLTLKILLAVAPAVIFGALQSDPTLTLIAAALGPVLGQGVTEYAKRRGWRRRHFLLLTLLLFLFHGAKRAYAAVRRRKAPARTTTEAAGSSAWPSVSASLVLGVVATALTVGAFTVVEVARGESLVADRELTFFDRNEHGPAPDVVEPRLTLPDDIVVEAEGARQVWYTVSAVDSKDGALEPECAPARGARFPLGTTVVQCRAADKAGNQALGAFSVTVNEARPSGELVWRYPASVEAEAEGPAGASLALLVTARDESDGVVPVTCAPRVDSKFAFGRTIVVCTARAPNGSVERRRFAVFVRDSTAPRLSLPGDIALETAHASRTVTYAVSANDDVDGPVAVTCTPASGSPFTLGTTIVRCRAVDAHRNGARESFSVTIVESSDTEPPEVDVPEDMVVEATSVAGASVAFEVEADDNEDNDVDVRCSPRSGATFELGSTRVRCTATDDAGNHGFGSFDVVVRDSLPPSLELPQPQEAEAESPRGARVRFEAAATDAVDGLVTVACSPESGSTFPITRTVVRCHARDRRGHDVEGTFTVTVVDRTGPKLNLPSALTVEATSRDGAVVTYEHAAVDLVDGRVRVRCEPGSGRLFPLGTTPVECSAADGRGNRSRGGFTVAVVDRTGPVVRASADVTAEARSASGARVKYRGATAVDAVDGPVRASCAPRVGSLFPLGRTVVTCKATDSRGNVGSATFDVIVRDTTAPTLVIENMDRYAEEERNGVLGAVVTFPDAEDAVAGKISPTCRPPSGSFFAAGRHRVRCWAVDPSGNRSRTVFFLLTVITPPE